MIINTIFNPQDSVCLKEKPGIELIVESIQTESRFDGDLDNFITDIKINCFITNNGFRYTYHPNQLMKYDPNWQYEYCKREIEKMPEWKKRNL